MAASLEDLPNEVLSEIVKEYCRHCREADQPSKPFACFEESYGSGQKRDERSWYSLERHALFGLCLASKRLRAIAEPILYHEFALGYGDSWKSQHYSWNERLESFKLTIFQRQELASFVRVVAIRPELVAALGKSADHHGIEPSQKRRALDYAIGDTEPVPLKIYRYIIQTLILRLPNLERFSSRFTCEGEWKQIPWSIRTYLDISALPLTTLELRSSLDSYLNIDFDSDARWILSLAPNLDTVNIYGCNSISNSGTLPVMHNLRNLRLMCAHLNEEQLATLLFSCPGLQSFHYVACAEPRSPSDSVQVNGPGNHFRLSDAVHYLNRCMNSLLSFHLDLRFNFDIWDSDGTYEDSTSSMKTFGSLDHIFLNFSLLNYGTSDETASNLSSLLTTLLPEKLRSLELDGYIPVHQPRITASMLGLLDAIDEGRFSELERITVDVSAKLDEYGITKRFRDLGISFEHISPMPDPSLRAP